MTRVSVAVAAACALAAIASAGPARAHVEVLPGVVTAGDETVLNVELPRLRPGPPPTSLEVAGAGVRSLDVAAAGRAGAETRWRARVAVDAEPGTVQLVLRAGFADGRSVEVPASLTVVPARDEAMSAARTAALVAALGAAGLGAGALALRVARRRA